MDELDMNLIPEEDSPETLPEDTAQMPAFSSSMEENTEAPTFSEEEAIPDLEETASPALEDIIAEFHEESPQSDSGDPAPPQEDTAPEDTAAAGEEKETSPEDAPAAPQEEAASYEEYVDSDYVPNPIVFQPPSRLRQLRKKLMVGPEHRYYELTEIGLAKLAIAIIITAVFFLITAAATYFFYASSDPEKYARFLIFTQVVGIFVSALFGCNLIIDGGSDLLHGKFTRNTMLLLTLIACGVDAFFCLDSLRLPFGAAFCFETVMALWATYHKRSTEIGQMDTMRKAVRLDALAVHPDYYDGKSGVLTREGQVEEFMDNYDTPSAPDKLLSYFTLLGFIISLCVGAIAFFRYGAFFAVRFFAAGMLCACPATTFITLTRPYAILEQRLHRLGSVICGWQGIRSLSKKVAIPMDDTDLFPIGTVKLNGVKVWSQSIEHAIGCAAALAELQESSLLPIFQQLRESRNGRYYEVDEFRLYDNGGLGGIINEETVLMGPYEFMQQMGVEIPSGSIVENAVYLSADQKLCAVFAMSYSENRATAKSLNNLCGYRWLTPLFIGTDCSVTPQMLRQKYRVKSKRFGFPPLSERPALKNTHPDPETPASILLTRNHLSAKAFSVTGARCLGQSMRIGAGLHLAAGIIGLATMVAIGLIGDTGLLSASNILLYQFVWVIPAILISERTRIL